MHLDTHHTDQLTVLSIVLLNMMLLYTMVLNKSENIFQMLLIHYLLFASCVHILLIWTITPELCQES